MPSSSLTPASFSTALKECLAQAGLPLQASLAVGVSGGPDSMALLHLAVDFVKTHGITLHAFTVDHALRDASAEEAKQVAQWCEHLGVPHRILLWKHEAVISGNLPAAARAARYALLSAACRAVGADALLTAHTQDDQAETLLHHLVRGSGVDGLCAMAPAHRQNDGWLLRPLLDVSKAELIALCKSKNQPYIEDPTNTDPRFSRTLFRRLLGEFADTGLSAARLAETTEHMSRARDALEAITETALQDCVQQHAFGVTEVALERWKILPEEIRLRVLRRLLLARREDGKLPRFEGLMGLQKRLMQEEGGRHDLGPCLWHWRKGILRLFNTPRSLPKAGLWEERAAEWQKLGWMLEKPESTENMWLAPLGEEGWTWLCTRHRPIIREARRLAPPMGWQALPCLWQLGGQAKSENSLGHWLEKPLILPHILPAGEPSTLARYSARWQPFAPSKGRLSLKTGVESGA